MVFDNKVEEMAKYLREGGNPNFSINYGARTPIFEAESVEMGKLLVDAGADIHYHGSRNMTPLLSQANSTRPNLIAYLLSLDPQLIKDVDDTGETALHICVRHAYEESLECAKILLAANPPVDINYINNKGLTALDLAVRSTNVATKDIIKLLLEHGAVRNDKTPSRYDYFINEYIATRNIPRGSENSTYLNEIKEGNMMVNFPTNNVKTEYHFKRYYKNSPQIREMSKNPQTRRALRNNNFKVYKAHLVDLQEGGKKNGRKNRRRKTRKSRNVKY